MRGTAPPRKSSGASRAHNKIIFVRPGTSPLRTEGAAASRSASGSAPARELPSGIVEKQKDFNGTWLDKDGQRLKAIIEGPIIRWPTGTEGWFQIMSSTTCRFLQCTDNVGYNAELNPDGTLHEGVGAISGRVRVGAPQTRSRR